jgi:PAS domain S-box-containing protein
MPNQKEQYWRILHVDDDEDDFILTRSMLEMARGRTILLEWASTYEMGQKMLDENQYDAALIDYDLGVSTGVDLIREFVQHGYESPLILYTGRGSYEVDVEAMHAGATIYLPKGEANPLSLERSIRYAIERKQTEEAHRMSEHKLRIALEAAQLGSWIYHFDTDILEMDERAQKLYRADTARISHEEIVSKYLHPDDLQPMRAHLAAVSRPGGSGHYQIEYRIQQQDGSYCWLNAWGLVQFEGDGEHCHPVTLTGASRDVTDARKAELELQASEKRLRMAMSAGRSGAWEVDFRTGENNWSPELFDLLGIDQQVTPRQDDYEARIHPDDREAVIELFRNAVANGEPGFSSEFRMVRPDGETIWVSAMGTFEYDEKEAPIRGYGINQDISEQMWVKETLLASETRYRDLFNNHHTPMILIDPENNGAIVSANRAACRFYGWELEALTQKSITEINVLPPDQVRKEMASTENADGSKVFHFRHRLANGEIRDVEVHSGKIQWDDKGYLFSIIIDVTERQKIERALQESENRFRLIADTMPSLVWTAEPNGKVDYVNRQYEDFTGNRAYSGDGWYGVPIHPDDRKTTMEKWRDALRTGQPFEIEHRIKRQDGAYRWFLTRGVPVWKGDWITKWYGSATDIHEVKQYQEGLKQNNQVLRRLSEELKRSNQALTDFASIASHDLQEPLRKILAFGDRLSDTYSAQLGEHGQDYVNRMLAAAQRMQKMIQGLLDYSRVTTKARPFELVDLNQTAAEVLSDLEVLVTQKNGRVEIGELPELFGDPVQLRQLLQNLIGNALKYHRPGIPPVIKLTAEQPPELCRSDCSIRLIIEDNGIGFDERHIDRIFQPMQRLHTHNQYEGTGIGLAVCAKIVDRHGGRITARSNPNQGSLFVIDLPLNECSHVDEICPLSSEKHTESEKTKEKRYN